MIILSQNKMLTTESMNLSLVYTDMDDNSVNIKAREENSEIYIGHYKSAERAKEVLREICTNYALEKLPTIDKIPEGYEYSPVYEMPEK